MTITEKPQIYLTYFKATTVDMIGNEYTISHNGEKILRFTIKE